MAERIRLAQIGLGYWGPNLLRNLLVLPQAQVVAVADLDPRRLVSIARAGGDMVAATDPYAVLDRPDIEAVVIATPAHTHFELTQAALQRGKHVLVEKPLAMCADEGLRLVALAEEKGRVLMAGHTFLYNAAVRRLKQYVDDGELGDVLYLYSQRLNLGRVRQDVNALWNFGPHDVSIILYLLGEVPVDVTARGFAYLQAGVEDVVFMTLAFAGGVGAHVQISWLDPRRVRRTTLVGSRKMAVYDDVSTEAKIVIYDRRVDRIPTADSPREFQSFAEFQLLPRRGDVVIPALEFPEPLQVQCQHFLECIRTGARPLSDGYQGVEVVKVLEAAQASMACGGAPQRIVPPTHEDRRPDDVISALAR